jgi:RarD protein
VGTDAEMRRGLLYGAAAYLLWGAFPLYWPLLEPASPLEILAHRILWSLLFITLVLWRTRAWRSVGRVLADRRRRTLLILAASVISVNWCTYIWGVNSGQVVETSLGYFINPLITVLLGVFLLRETLRKPQWVAVGIASIAIVVLAVDYGRLPWIALVLATSFGMYGYFKKRAAVGAAESLAVETGVLALPALTVLLVLQLQGTLVFAHNGGGNPRHDWRRDRHSTSVLRRRHSPTAPVDCRPSAIPGAGTAVRGRRRHRPRAHASRPVGRLHTRVDRADCSHRGRDTAPTPACSGGATRRRARAGPVPV